MKKLLLGLGLIFLAISAVFALRAKPVRDEVTPPNIIVIETDDQRWDTISHMPTVMSRIAGEGINFTNSFATTSLCCPSRSSFLTGLYTHNHGVWKNDVTLFDDSSTLATWLQSAGYTTSLVGKYLNGYDNLAPYIPPGWSDWHVFASDDPALNYNYYYNYTLNDNGTINSFGNTEADYSTDVLRDRAVNFIQNAQGPFFLWLTPFAPHGTPIVAKRHIGTCNNLTPNRSPSFNEADVSDKPAWVRSEPLLSAAEIKRLDNARKNQICTLKAVDEAVDAIVNALGPELDNTVIIFTSDNGLMSAEHRLKAKNKIYEESIRVPLVIRYPQMIVPGTVSDKLVLNIDLAPTIAELAGVNVGLPVNGQSLVPLLSNPQAAWRSDFLFEHDQSIYGVRQGSYKYVEYNNGDREFYDLAGDPYELTSQHNNPAYVSIINTLRTRLVELKAE